MHRRPIRNLGSDDKLGDDFEEVYVRVAKRSERRRDGNGRDHPHRWRIAMQSHPERCLNIYIHTHVMYAIIIIIIIIIMPRHSRTQTFFFLWVLETSSFKSHLTSFVRRVSTHHL